MSDEREAPNIAMPPSGQNRSHSDGQSDSVSQFLSVLSRVFDPASARASLRTTPHGVFVERNFIPKFFEAYQNWFREKLGREAGLSVQKCFKKFFNTPAPPLYYLVEAKQCMIGHLVRREYQDPQRLGLPTYLGTVDDTRRMLHPRDPMLMYMTNLEVRPTPQGRAFILKTGRNQWSFDENVLLEFARLLQRSPGLSARFSGFSGALRDSFKALSEVLEQAKLAPPTQRLLVPGTYARRRDINYIALGTLTFVVEGRNRIVSCYEVGGRTLFRFIKREFSSLSLPQDRRHRPPYEILPARNRDLALFHHRNTSFALHPRSFLEFVRSIMRSRDEGSPLPLRYTVGDCVEALYRIIQSSEPISPQKVSRHLERIRTRRPMCLINSQWIVVTTQRNRIISCVNRFSHGPGGHHGSHGHGGGRGISHPRNSDRRSGRTGSRKPPQ